MKKAILALALVSLFSCADELETAMGLGHQFGGVIGAQIAYKTPLTKFYASLGVLGVATGFQTTFSVNSKHAFGAVVGREELQSEDGFFFATYDYHFKGFVENGWVLGTGIGVTREDEFGLFADSGETESTTSITLNLGYKF